MLKVVESSEESELTGVVRRRRPYHRLAWAGFAALLLIALLAGGLYWQATRASIGVGFLRDRIEAEVGRRLPPDARLAIGSTAFSYRGGEGVILRMRDVEVLLPGIATVAVDEVSSTTTFAALLSRRMNIQSVTVTGVDISIAAGPHLAETSTSAEHIRYAAEQLVANVVEADSVMRGAGLKQVIVREATFHVGDAAAPPLQFARVMECNWLPLGPGRSKAWLQFAGKNGATWDLTVEHRQGATNSAVVVELEEMPIAAFAPRVAAGEGSARYDANVTLQARIAASKDGSFAGLRGLISSGPGELSLTGQDRINILAAALAFDLDPTGDRLNFPNGEVHTKTGQVIFEGVADLSEAEKVTVLARIREGYLPTSVGNEDEIRLVGGGALARINVADRSLEIERLDLRTQQGSASIIGQASMGGDAPGVSFALSFTEMPAGAIRALWPPFIAVKTRGWFDANVKSGVLGPATLQVALPPDFIGSVGKVFPTYAFVGSMPFHDAEFSPLKSFPTIRQAQGAITFGDAAANIVAQSGVMTVAGMGDLDASGTMLRIPELGRRQQRGDLSLELSGPAAALAILSDTPPLSIARKRGIISADISGTATLSLSANIPLTKPDFTGVVPTFRLTLTDFSSASPIDDRAIEQANLVLEGSPLSYTVKGEGTLDGLKASVDMIMGSGAPGQSAVTASLNDEDRERLGFGLGSLVTGPVQASLNLAIKGRQPVALDLKDARISLPFLGWEKGPGVPATASFVMDKTDTGVRVTDLLLSGKGFEARGALLIGPDGRLAEMTLDKLALRSGDQLSAVVTANGGGYDVRVNGSSFDARGLLRGVRSGFKGGSADIFPIRLSLDLESVAGENEVILSNVSGSVVVASNGLDAALLKGNTSSSQSFEWKLGREGDARVLRLFAAGGGALIRFAGIYSRVRDGNLILDYSGKVGGTGTGVLVLRDFRVVNEQALKPVLDSGSARDGMVHANSQASGDLSFTQLRIPFRQEGWVIVLDAAALRGSLIGATAGGTINLPSGKMAVSGTLIPAFGINNIAGSIPILGAILGGGRNEGLVGITYKLFGPLDQPTLTMNPMSAIAPGIFRKIFEYR